MRRLRYVVATSLDGYVAGPGGEIDWIVMDPEVDFKGLANQFDTVFMGRRTFETALSSVPGLFPEMETYVFSRTLNPRDYRNVTVVPEKPDEVVARLRARRGKDIWLFGGGNLFRSLVDANLVDTVELAVMPTLLGGGIPLLPPPADRIPLQFVKQKVYNSGIVQLEYAIAGSTFMQSQAPR